MYSWKKMMAVCVLLMASFVVLLPISANAYLVHLSSFESGSGSTGRIYGNDLSTGTPGTPFPFVFCIEEKVTVTVPGTYYAQNVALTGAELKAAWLMKNYGSSAYGKYGSSTFDYRETGIVVQNAIWSVTGQNMDFSSGKYYDLAKYMITQLPSSDLSGLTSSYVRMNLFTDPNFSIHVQDQIRPVPIPGALWLLGSGLVGLVGIRRRVAE